MKKRHFIQLISLIKESLSAHKMADWNDKKVVELVAYIITKKFARYIKDQESLEKLGKTEEDFLAPPNGLNQ